MPTAGTAAGEGRARCHSCFATARQVARPEHQLEEQTERLYPEDAVDIVSECREALSGVSRRLKKMVPTGDSGHTTDLE